jgi:UDP-N-acetylglucosamine diphosphorylase / glucose-1-phosphate thymidylyltransferase / UDP-N-acetylgalactosamine diphosphorylase / glucosamine-1-phosphate N-acetyltransferase / galactosamine-1-phosphate N-acetyltransferase
MDNTNLLRPEGFFERAAEPTGRLFEGCRFVWEALPRISSFMKEELRGNVSDVACFMQPLLQTVIIWNGRVWREDFQIMGGDATKGTFSVRVGGQETAEAVVLYAGAVLWDEQIQLGAGTVVEPGALIKGPTIIGRHTEVRQGAYVRGKCIVGDRCVVGHTTEMKSSVLLDGAKAGHFAYIGDSILGHNTNLGAGTKLANLKLKGDTVHIPFEGRLIDTGLRKFGAIIGDNTEIGCNAVTNPGAMLGRGSAVFPTVSVRAGYYAANSVIRG